MGNFPFYLLSKPTPGGIGPHQVVNASQEETQAANLLL